MIREAIGQIRIRQAFFEWAKIVREAVVLCGRVRRVRDPDDMAAAYSVQQIDSCIAFAAGQMGPLYLILQIRIKEETDNLAYFARVAKVG